MELHSGNTEDAGAIHREMREKYDLTVEDSAMHHSNMVHNVVAGLHEAFQQYQFQTKTPTATKAPVDHVANAVQNTHPQLATQLQQIQAIMQAMQMQYAAVPHGIRHKYGGRQDYGGRGYHVN